MLPIIRVTTVPQKLLNITPAFPMYHMGYPQGVPTSLILFYFSSPSLWRSLHVSQLKRNNTMKQNVKQRFYDTWSSKYNWRRIHTVQFSHSVMSDSLRPHEPQHTRPPCPSPTPRVHPNPCPLTQWCHPTILSSDVSFSSGPQSFQAPGMYQSAQ